MYLVKMEPLDDLLPSLLTVHAQHRPLAAVLDIDPHLRDRS